MIWLRRLRTVTRLLVDWDIFKHAFDDAMGDEGVRRRLEAVCVSDPLLAAHAAMLRALWAPVERDLRELR
ncbi:MAG: hypothetical protein HUU17_02705 [Chthonomonadales bacterium]|nr:hypothetical protein [Chthonomonadales bacterium]